MEHEAMQRSADYPNNIQTNYLKLNAIKPLDSSDTQTMPELTIQQKIRMIFYKEDQ